MTLPAFRTQVLVPVGATVTVSMPWGAPPAYVGNYVVTAVAIEIMDHFRRRTLEVLDLKGGVRGRSVRGLREPQGVAFAPDLGRIFVSNGRGGSCEILDGKTLGRVGHVPDLEDADNVRYDAGKREVYVGYGSGALCVIDGQSGRRVGQIRLVGHPESFQLAKAGSLLFVNVPTAGQIAVVDRGKQAVIEEWPLRGAGAIAVVAPRNANHYATAARYPTAAGARTSLFVPELDGFFLAVPHRGSQQAEVPVYRVAP